jgi:hypothetical protein
LRLAMWQPGWLCSVFPVGSDRQISSAPMDAGPLQSLDQYVRQK